MNLHRRVERIEEAAQTAERNAVRAEAVRLGLSPEDVVQSFDRLMALTSRYGDSEGYQRMYAEVAAEWGWSVDEVREAVEREAWSLAAERAG